MQILLPYARQRLPVEVPDHALVALPGDVPGVGDVRAEIRRALEAPIACPPLRELAAGKGDAAIVINDITRPVPSRELLEAILDELRQAGMRDEAVRVVIANGNHRPNTRDEIAAMVGDDLAGRLDITNHDCEDRACLVPVEAPGLDEPAWINARVGRASLKILTGLIGPHQSAGYSGGRKSLVPGVAGLETIARHHSFPIRPYAPSMGWMHGNPFHELALSIARAAGVDFIVNVVKNWRGEVVRAVAGDLAAAHAEGVRACEQSWVVDLPRRFDVVVVTPGGHPRDLDLHQAQKALAAAELAAAPGGIIVLVAACGEGTGKFAAWFEGAESPAAIIERFRREGFTRQQSSKAFMCARALQEHRIIVACDGIDRRQLEAMFFEHAATPQQAIDRALGSAAPEAGLLVMPCAIDCVPRVVPPANGPNPFQEGASWRS
jgi:nickel-dependent lactate racemase